MAKDETFSVQRKFAVDSLRTKHGAIDPERVMNAAAMVQYMRLIKRLEQHASHFEDLIQMYRQVSEQARIDPLTELLNRRAFEEEVKQRFAEYRRYATPMSFMMIDIDHFKAINDKYGHAAGDRALKAVATCLKYLLRVCDVAARWGGEEFIVCLQYLSPADIENIAERIRREIADFTFDAEHDGPKLTASIGVSFVQADDLSYEQAIGRADRAMYEAKSAGRNRILLSRS